MAKGNEGLQAMSDGLAAAVKIGGGSTVMVNARRRLPASGVVIEKDLVLTASRALQLEEGIEVVLPDGNTLKAELLGRDPNSDLALLRLSEASASPAKMAKEDSKIGQIALALGRPTKNGIQASFGIVSAISGPSQLRHGGFIDSHIRSDAIPYPGFSGGPLVDIEGQVLGINTSGIGRGRSITIPAKGAMKIAESLKEHGAVKRGFLGIRGQIVDLPEDSQKIISREQASGILLVEIEESSPAADSELRVSDIVLGINGIASENHEALMSLLSNEVVGKEIEVQVLRGDSLASVKVTVGEHEMPAHKKGSHFGHHRHGRRFRHGHWGWRRRP